AQAYDSEVEKMESFWAQNAEEDFHAWIESSPQPELLAFTEAFMLKLFKEAPGPRPGENVPIVGLVVLKALIGELDSAARSVG
ncbi:MAG TPA: hypothetical protein VN794_05445, partial [Methylomirabilota bacterium]|nr:hypothetical protein [Methylomirabilota bacterium]